MEERRLEGGRLLRAGRLTHAAIAQRLGVSLRAVQQWAKQLRDDPSSGLKALRSRPRSGRPSRLSAAQWHSVLRTLRKGALKAGFETDRWTLRRIRDLIRRQFGVAYHPNYLAARLRASGWSPQVPAVRAKERDEEVIRAWLEQDWPRIRKKARRKHAAIVFIDETGFSFRCRPGTTWAPTGRTPVLRRVSKRREVSTAVALALSGRIYKRHFDHAVHGVDVVAFLRHLRRYLPGPLMVIWDRLQAHRSVEVKAYRGQHPEIMVEELPTYAPDLNPEEGCHGDVKRHLLNATPEDTRQIRKQANRGFARLRHRPDLILAFFHHAGYRVKRLT